VFPIVWRFAFHSIADDLIMAQPLLQTLLVRKYPGRATNEDGVPSSVGTRQLTGVVLPYTRWWEFLGRERGGARLRVAPGFCSCALAGGCRIPDSWPRAFGMDVGWNRTAVVWGARDPGSGVIYL
jgi:hypothetical protein